MIIIIITISSHPPTRTPSDRRLSSTSSLSLSCKPLYHALGPRTQSLRRIDEHRDQKLQFLDLLARELPRYLLCHACCTLHLREYNNTNNKNPTTTTASRASALLSVLERPAPMYWHLYLSCEKLSGGINCCQHCYLRYKLVQLALRTHSLTSPAHGIPVSALAHSCVTTTWQGQRPQFELLPKIVEGRFMLRLRYRVRVTFANNDGDGEDVLSQVECLNGLCQHSWGCVPAICHCAVRQIITGRMEKKKKKKCIGCNLIRRCKLCAPECQVTLEDVRADSDSDSCAVVVTAWKDLGAPRSPLSEPWRSHRSDYCVPEHPYLGQVAGFRYGLKAAFEGVEGLEPQVEGEGEVLRFRM